MKRHTKHWMNVASTTERRNNEAYHKKMKNVLKKTGKVLLRNDDKINTTIWRSYFSFFQGAKTANSKPI